MDVVKSINNVSIRLTNERWVHIVETHDDLAGYYEEVMGAVETPDFIINGYGGALVALKQVGEKFLAVVYRETNPVDGFIITAYISSKIKLGKQEIVWQRQQ